MNVLSYPDLIAKCNTYLSVIIYPEFTHFLITSNY